MTSGRELPRSAFRIRPICAIVAPPLFGMRPGIRRTSQRDETVAGHKLSTAVELFFNALWIELDRGELVGEQIRVLALDAENET